MKLVVENVFTQHLGVPACFQNVKTRFGKGFDLDKGSQTFKSVHLEKQLELQALCFRFRSSVTFLSGQL